MRFYAHSTESDDKSDWQTLSGHLTDVGDLAEKFASYFCEGISPLAKSAGLLHDLGKYTDEFQRRLTGDYPRVDHATHGAKVALEHYGQLGYLIAYAIAGHHAGLANGSGMDGKRTSLANRLENNLPLLLDAWKNELILPENLQAAGFCQVNEYHMFQFAFLVRMIFSCLVDADFLDTEAFYAKVENKQLPRGFADIGMQDLQARLNTHLQQFDNKVAANERHQNLLNWRREILTTVRERAEHTPGLFSLTVPTGGGKTLTSLAFALDHAIRYGLRRVIYVIPFTSIVDQTAKTFRQALGDLQRGVLEHHSAFITPKSNNKTPDEYQARKKLQLAMENWDAPIVVTTAVQFFESLFAARTSQCRKLHNIASSVIVLDEAQTLPLPLLRPCVAALSELSCNYRSSIVLCTATQPALKAPKFNGGFEQVRELAPEPAIMFQRFRRTAVRHIGALSDEELQERIEQQEQVLCIVNNRRHARVLSKALKGVPGVRHLSTAMCAAHRYKVLQQIREDLDAGEPCRLIATSLIEAGVDVDFPQVLRAEAGLDSIAQAAGRCNRENKRLPEDSEVLIFTPDEKWKPPAELKQFAEVAAGIIRRHPDDLMGLQAIQDYFEDLYWRKGEKELDKHALLVLLDKSKLESLPMEDLAEKFCMIENKQRPIIIPYDRRVKRWVRYLYHAQFASGLARKFQPYVVQVPEQAYQALASTGSIQAVTAEKFGDQFVVLGNEKLYTGLYGLDWDDPGFISGEDSVVS